MQMPLHWGFRCPFLEAVFFYIPSSKYNKEQSVCFVIWCWVLPNNLPSFQVICCFLICSLLCWLKVIPSITVFVWGFFVVGWQILKQNINTISKISPYSAVKGIFCHTCGCCMLRVKNDGTILIRTNHIIDIFEWFKHSCTFARWSGKAQHDSRPFYVSHVMDTLLIRGWSNIGTQSHRNLES